MPPSPKLQGDRFNKLLVIAKTNKRRKGKVLWECLCDCGASILVATGDLNSGNTDKCNSCGKSGEANPAYKHGASHSRLHNIWSLMRDRCNNPNNKRYEHYGDRGIKVCAEWDNFDKFKHWAENNGYLDYLTIDRRHINYGYEPDNCQWITRAENTIKGNTIDKEQKI